MKELKDIPRWDANNGLIHELRKKVNELNAAVRELREELEHCKQNQRDHILRTEGYVKTERRYSVEDLREKLRTSYPSPWNEFVPIAEYGRLYDFLKWLKKQEGEKHD